MAYSLTQRTKDALSRELIEPNLILDIAGAPKKYAVRIAKQSLTYDMPGVSYDDPDLYYDGLILRNDNEDLISLSGTTTTISQQLEPDKGAASSTQTLTLTLIDRNDQITELASPGVILEDVLYTDCKLYFGLYETAFPEDYIEIFNGKVMGINPKIGSIDFVVTHPDDVKRSSIYERVESTVVQTVNFDSSLIQDIFYQKRSDVVGNVSITYTTAGIGDNAIVTVIGNDISVQIDGSVTRAKTIKKKIEAHEDASQLVTMEIKGDPINIQHAQATTFLTSDTEVYVDNVTNYLLPLASGLLKTYIKIDEELIEYTGIDTVNNKFTGCTRQALTSFGAVHEEDTRVQSFYKYGDNTDNQGNAIYLALYLLLSGADNFYQTATSASVNNVPGIGVVANSMYFPGVYLIRDDNVSIGDLATSTGATVDNTFTNKQVAFVAETDAGSYVIFDSVAFVTELTGAYVVQFKSQFNVLPDGAGLLPSQVDIAQFIKMRNTYSTQIAIYEFYFKDTINTKDFINEQILLPSAMYSVPRKGKVSVGITSPPLYDANSQSITIDNVKDPTTLKFQRSVSQNFYNAVAYKYNPDSVEDIFLNKDIEVSADSSNRIGAPARVFLLEAEGLRLGPETDLMIDRNSKAFLDRYKFGAEQIQVNVLFKTGFGVEVGDACLFGDSTFQIADTKKGSKNFSPRIMEVINKSWNWKTGDISLTLLDTTYSSSVRVGVFSPTTILGSGSTTTNLVMTKSFGTTALQKEKDKWNNYVGREIVVHSEDWSVAGTTYIQSFDPSNDNIMQVSPPLPFAPLDTYMVDIVGYEEVDILESFYKNVHVFWDHEVAVDSGADSTHLDVSIGDETKFFVGSLIRIHNFDYSIDSGLTGLRVTDITGQTLTFEDAGFTPDNTMTIDLIGFASDEGKPYVWI